MTISLDDEAYLSLVDCAAKEARNDLSRLSISRTLQKIMREELGKLNYFPPRHPERAHPFFRARRRRGSYTSNNEDMGDSFPLVQRDFQSDNSFNLGSSSSSSYFSNWEKGK